MSTYLLLGHTYIGPNLHCRYMRRQVGRPTRKTRLSPHTWFQNLLTDLYDCNSTGWRGLQMRERYRMKCSQVIIIYLSIDGYILCATPPRWFLTKNWVFQIIPTLWLLIKLLHTILNKYSNVFFIFLFNVIEYNGKYSQFQYYASILSRIQKNRIQN